MGGLLIVQVGFARRAGFSDAHTAGPLLLAQPPI